MSYASNSALAFPPGGYTRQYRSQHTISVRGSSLAIFNYTIATATRHPLTKLLKIREFITVTSLRGDVPCGAFLALLIDACARSTDIALAAFCPVDGHCW
jgi:hypothetical protein